LDLARLHVGLGQSLLDKRQDFADMISRSELGHDPTVGGMHVDLAKQPM
jgi:hypothetical protein